MGVRNGDRVAVLQDDCIEVIELYFAIPKLGATYVPINIKLATREIVSIVNDAEASTLIFGEKYSGIIDSIIPKLEHVKNYVCIGGNPKFAANYEELIKGSADIENEFEVDDDDAAFLIYTSGTTGSPKGALLTHRNMFSNCMACLSVLNIEHDDVFLNLLPLYYMGGLGYVLPRILVGATIIIHGKFSPSVVLQTIESKSVSSTFMVPAMAIFILESADISKYRYSSLKTIGYSGAPMPVEVLKKAMKVFQCDFVQIYGLTELSCACITYLSSKDHILEGAAKVVKRLESAGRISPTADIRILDEGGNEVRRGEVGEVVVRGQLVCKGYWKQSEMTAKAFEQGWFHTGDLGKLDDDSYLYLVDRQKDMIISGGENIYSKEIEEVLYTNPAVLEAAVIGVPDARWGEAVKAIVVLKPGMSATEEDIIEFCKRNLARFKKPKSVEFVENLPRTHTGKVQKNLLREQYWKGYEKRIH
jgi:long-chain acyl-CoA synthetase